MIKLDVCVLKGVVSDSNVYIYLFYHCEYILYRITFASDDGMAILVHKYVYEKLLAVIIFRFKTMG